MQSKLIHEEGGKRTFAIILQTGDGTMHCLQEFAARERLGGAQLTAIGPFGTATVAFFDPIPGGRTDRGGLPGG